MAITITDKHSLLTSSQITLLHDCSKRPFKIGKFNSLDEILSLLKVNVIIEPGKPKRVIHDNFINEARKQLWEEVNRLEREIKSGDEESMRNYREAFDKASRTIKVMQEYFDGWHEMTLRGEYLPDKNIIKLYPDAMRQEYGGNRMDELLVSTLAHETMHAYFNRPRHKSYPYAPFVEEPLAEFGMLLFLLETNSSYYDWAYNDVDGKRTFYSFGARLMDQYQSGESQLRNYLERYKVNINQYDLPIIDSYGDISLPALPKRGRGSMPTTINGLPISAKWHDVFKYPPRYFFDPKAKTLGLDGDWGTTRHEKRIIDLDIYIHMHDVETIYLGDNFTFGEHTIFEYIFSKAVVIVSPKNKKFSAVNGIPVHIKDKKPVLPSCGKGYYKLCRNGKWGAVDEQLNVIVPLKYDCIWSCDKNGLFMVHYSNKYGLVDTQGKVQVAYDDIDRNNDGTYTVKQGNQQFKIDKNNNRI